MTIKDIAAVIERFAPLALQESWDNAGIQVGNPAAQATGVLLCTDITPAIVAEAAERGMNMVVSHHPLIFRGLKKIMGRNAVEQAVELAIRHGIALYSAHTNADSAWGGVSHHMGTKLGLTHMKPLVWPKGTLRKVAVTVPTAQAQQVEQAMLDAGAGRLGPYDRCSYTSPEGQGRYRALQGAQPARGSVGQVHSEPEVKVEVVCQQHLTAAVVRAMFDAHPYEVPAFDVIELANYNPWVGLGVVGNLPQPMAATALLEQVKAAFGVHTVRYSGDASQQVQRIALVGGAGVEFVPQALQAGAQVMITGDVKYHEFQANESSIVLADIGHYESEQFTKEIFAGLIARDYPTLPVAFAAQERNPVQYL